ncbi:hypothetical protein FRC11_001171, partial [Ceratobasidium sp. 423]
RFTRESWKRDANVALGDTDEDEETESEEDDVNRTTGPPFSEVPMGEIRIPSPHLPFREHTGASSTQTQTWDQFLDELDSPFTIPGPQLPDDPPDAIYNDYGGELSQLGNPDPTELPSPTESSIDESNIHLAFGQPSTEDDPFDFVSQVLSSQKGARLQHFQHFQPH